MPTRGWWQPARGPALAAALAVATACGPLLAQGAAQPDRIWSLDSLRSGFCIHFLIQPESAATLFPGAQLREARGITGLHPALRRLIQDTPDVGTWIPSQFCIYHFGSTASGGHTYSDRKHAQPQTIAFWTAQAPAGVPATVRLLTSNSGLSGSVRALGLSIQVIKSHVGKVPQSTDDRYELKYDGSELTWDGHATGDSTAAAPLNAAWMVTNRAGRPVHLQMTVPGLGSRLMVGALRVEGKGELARALIASPIRIVGPLVWGGSGEVMFAP